MSSLIWVHTVCLWGFKHLVDDKKNPYILWLCALGVNKCDSSVCKWNARTFAQPKQLINSIEPDFPCLADEIAEPRPDMNIKNTAFTESKNFFYMLL